MKALALLSGGLDSTLAIKLVLDQGIDVIALNFTSPFYLCNQKGRCFAPEVAKKFKIPLKVINKGKEYLRMIRKPKYGYGSGMNPCIDCRIFILRKAKKYANKIGAKFIFTGEVLGQRPMSQHMRALRIIEKEAGLEGKILRPLSAKLLPLTEAERKGWVDRNRFMSIKGRSRKAQIRLAKKLGINDYPWPAGGCLLTHKEFANKLRDLFKHKKRVRLKDVELLKVGRHFRLGNNKIIVGRNKEENEKLMRLKNKTDYVFEVPNTGSPTTILQGRKTGRAVRLAARLTATYSDAKEERVLVRYGKEKLNKEVMVSQLKGEEIERIRI